MSFHKNAIRYIVNGQGKYGKYLQTIEMLTGFFVVNLDYIIASIFDADILGFRWKVTWLIINVCYLPVVVMMWRTPIPRSLHVDKIVRLALQAVCMHALFFFSILTFLDSWVHNVSFYVWFYVSMVVMLPLGWTLCRLFVKKLRRKGRNYSAAVIVGTNPTALWLREEMLSDPGYGYKCWGFFSKDRDDAMADAENYLGTVDDLEDFIGKNEVREIYYTLSGEDYETMHRVIKIADDNVLHFYYVPPLSKYVSRAARLSNIGQVPVLNIRKYPLSGTVNRVLKRAFDVAMSSAFLLVSPIIFIPVAVAIKISSPGPVFFRQRRTGYLGKEFNCWKFRTMRVNADSDKVQAGRNDVRVTRLGEFLRHSSIDELPQFINVLKGDMSVVGPRPHMIKHTDDYRKLIDKYMTRHLIKPGITGWAQVKGFRGQTEELWQMEKRVENDVWYIENWSFLLDIKIIVLTVINVFRGEENAF